MEETKGHTEITDFEQAVAYIEDIPRFTKKNSMEQTQAFLHRLGDPDRKMKILHIAGTNGKGSVCAYLCSVLREAGFRVGMFISPHLVDIRERFLLDGQMMEKEEFVEVFHTVKDTLERYPEELIHPTYFEFLFMMAMVYYGNHSVDYLVLETGLGGRLDATNSIATAQACVITRIGLDHMQYLGDTIGQIAGEKAGIIKEHIPIIYADYRKEASDVIKAQAAEKHAESYPVSTDEATDIHQTNKSIDFCYQSLYYGTIRLTLNTMARYQIENSLLAIRTIEVIGHGTLVTAKQLQDGISKTFWEGRMEEVLPDVIVDGAHNEDGIRAFLESVSKDKCRGKRSLLFSAVGDKQYVEMIGSIVDSGLFERFACVQLANYRAVPVETFEHIFASEEQTGQAARSDKIHCRFFNDVTEAFPVMLSQKAEGDRLYIAGSLYLAGEIKAMLRRSQND